jgi:NosR/NirI family transcriptional regulator, nitrous oxide reductase regulator
MATDTMKAWHLQSVRIGMLVLIALLIHWQHQKWLVSLQTVGLGAELLPLVHAVLPTAAKIVAPTTDNQFAVIADDTGTAVGRLARTSPQASHILGFSGPTDLLLIASLDDRLLAVKLLSSRDTRDHVQQVRDDPVFLNTFTEMPFNGKDAFHDIDAVSGATLTSLAIVESVRFRLSSTSEDSPAPATSLRFSDPPSLEDVRTLYPDVVRVVLCAQSVRVWNAIDATGETVGSLLRTSPASDNIVGYQGPTDTLIGFDGNGIVTGVVVGRSYDNEPYVDYVRDDDYFLSLFSDRSTDSLSSIDIKTDRIEGVSGATMTSMTVARGIIAAAQAHLEEVRLRQKRVSSADWRVKLSAILTLRNASTIVIVLTGIVIGLTRLRRRRGLRIAFQVVVIGWLGLYNGDMVSLALLLGWAQSGIAWLNAFGLTVLSVAALLVPVATGRNVYCSHVCPHGAVQQLIRNRLPWRLQLSRRIQRVLKWIPFVLISWVVLIGLLHLPCSAVDVEPFDAWLISIAGPASVIVAGAGLIAAAFVPMAYCRFGCPTGAILNFARGARSDRPGLRDYLALGLVIAATAIVAAT